jgi:uncharacterized protein YbaR (Trm112 family)
MKRNSLDLLACPACHAPLTLHDGTAGPLESGRLRCEHCQKDYPIEQGILHFVQPEQLTGLNRRFARMYDWYSWGYRLFSKIAFAYIGVPEERGRREITDRLEPRGGRGRAIYSEKTMTAERCAALTLHAAHKRRRELLMGPGPLAAWLKLLAPGFVDWFAVKVLLGSAIRRARAGQNAPQS